jgi:hypothetical protein
MTDSRLIPAAENWHPLDGVPAPEYIPPDWDGPHVGRRLIEAFKTLARLPDTGPGGCRTAWPLYQYEVREYFAALANGGLGTDVADELQRDRNRARVPASAEEIMRMECAIAWPARYLAGRAMLSFMVQEVARRRAQEWPLGDIARKLRRGPRYLRRCNRVGLDHIAAGLRADGVAVF